MKALCLLLCLLGAGLPLAAQWHLPTQPPTALETVLQRFSPRLRLAAAAPARRPAALDLTQPSRVVQYEWNPVVNAWQDPQLITYIYNAQGLPTQQTQADSATAVPSFRLNFTYDGQSRLTEVVQQDYLNGAWANAFRQTATFDAQGNTTEVLGQDWISGAWVTTFGTRFTNTYTASNFLAQQLAQTFDAGTAAFANDYKVIYKVPASGPYTEFTVQRWSAGQWQDESRVTGIAWYDFARQLPLGLEVQILINTAWVSVQRLTASYQPNGSSLTTIEQRPNPAGPWLNDERTAETYDAYDSKIDLLHELWDGAAWSLNYRNHALLTYNAQHVVLRRDEQLSTSNNGGQLVNQVRFNFGNFQVIPLSSRAVSAGPTLALYPNPATATTTLELRGLTTTAPVLIDMLTPLGQSVQTLTGQPQQGHLTQLLHLDELPAGVYWVRVRSADGQILRRVLRY